MSDKIIGRSANAAFSSYVLSFLFKLMKLDNYTFVKSGSRRSSTAANASATSFPEKPAI
jgi:hypothetical protein